MHILFEALDPKKGMTLGELRENVSKIAKLGTASDDQVVKVVLAKAFTGTIKSFEIEA